MALSTVNQTSNPLTRGQRFSFADATVIQRTQLPGILAWSKLNGADDLIIQTSDANFLVGSGRGVNLKGVKAGDTVSVNGVVGEVVAVNSQINTFAEGFRARPGVAIAGVPAAFGIFAFVQGVLARDNMAGLGLAFALIGAIPGLITMLGTGVWAARRQIDTKL